jgi:hypothetical protein
MDMLWRFPVALLTFAGFIVVAAAADVWDSITFYRRRPWLRQ